MDFHAEQIVSKKRTALDNLLIVLILFLTVVLWYLSLAFFSNIPTFSAILLLAIGWGAFKLIQTFNLEYEYELTNYYLDIDKIMGKARRKRIISIDLRTAEHIGYTDTYEFSNPKGIEKTYDLSGNPAKEGRVFIDFIQDEKIKKRVIICPDEKLCEYIKKAAPRVHKLS